MTAHGVSATGTPNSAMRRRWRQSIVWRWLALPWRAHDPGGQLFMACIAMIAFALAALAVPFTRPAWQVPSAGMVGVAVGVAWFYFLPRSLRLVAAGRSLRLPHARREIHAALFVYAVLGCMVPAMVFGAAGGPGLAIGLWFFAGSAAVFLFTVLPIWIAVGLMFLPAIMQNLSGWLAFSLPTPPQPGAPDFLAWLAVVGVVLAGLAVARWTWIITHRQPVARWRWSLAMALSNGTRALPHRQSGAAEAALIRRRRPKQQARIDLRGVGPGAPVKSLRVAIGGAYVPITWRSQVAGGAWMLALLAVCALFVLFSLNGQAQTRASVAHFMFLASGWFVLFVGLLFALSALLLLHRRWLRPNSTLALMALLPGLGHGQAVKERVMFACLRTPLITWLAMIVLGGVLIGWSTGGFSADLVALFAAIVLGGCVLILAMTLAILGHRRLTRGGAVVLSGYLALLSVASAVSAFDALTGAPPDVVGKPVMGVFTTTLWIGLFGALVVVAWRGASAFMRQPHPFLANAP